MNDYFYRLVSVEFNFNMFQRCLLLNLDNWIEIVTIVFNCTNIKACMLRWYEQKLHYSKSDLEI